MPAFAATISSNIADSSTYSTSLAAQSRASSFDSTHERLKVISNSSSSYHGFTARSTTSTPSGFTPAPANAQHTQQTPSPTTHWFSSQSLIAGIVVGAVIGCTLVLCCFALWRRRRKRQQRIPPNFNAEPFWFTIDSDLGEVAALSAPERGLPETPAELVGTEAAAELDGRSLGRRYIQRPRRYRTLPRPRNSLDVIGYLSRGGRDVIVTEGEDSGANE